MLDQELLDAAEGFADLILLLSEKMDETAIPATASSISKRTKEMDRLLKSSQSAAAFVR
jgi:hypothetical protein